MLLKLTCLVLVVILEQATATEMRNATTTSEVCAENDAGCVRRLKLYLSGDKDLEDINIDAGASLEINIRTPGATGHRWELARGLIPHTVRMTAEPEIIPGEGIGAPGITRFRFKVDDEPNRGFTLYFQLRRPWEETPVKSFHVGFIANRPNVAAELKLDCEAPARPGEMAISYRIYRLGGTTYRLKEEARTEKMRIIIVAKSH